ncbi:helix-turn-helix domain-containing protein [Thalassospira xiamenensis]|jgi:transcriptional regulator with XRE-family HTH domain|uniref:helix-turn-helix domain-containing protein n=1 Tax=Thalassospira xiamenensis TaxID=220697 RepID=UPI001FFEDB23|nr:helix-turn-helix transcriptional regulator [Thalassospira xiamenensis]MCK2169088.1 helix-turn-helix domain-containing protein [Thalassospira xiamenensis]
MKRRLGRFDGPNVIDAHVAERIKMLRKVLSIKQRQLADLFEISPQQIQKFEAGRDRYKAGHLHLLSQMFGVEIDFFFAGIPDEIANMSRSEREKIISTVNQKSEVSSSSAIEAGFIDTIARLSEQQLLMVNERLSRLTDE